MDLEVTRHTFPCPAPRGWPVLTLVVLLSLFSFAGAGLAADPEKLVISQVNPKLPILSAYVDATRQDGLPVTGIQPKDFSASLGTQPLKISGLSSFDASREGVAYVFLVDISGSIGAAQFVQIQASIRGWIANLRSGDVAAICSFGDGYRCLQDFTASRPRLFAALDSLSPGDRQTHLHQALAEALAFQKRRDKNLPARRVIVLLSDGKDEGSGITADDVAGRIRDSQIPVYAIGFSRLAKTTRGAYLETLHRFAAQSGGIYVEAGAQSLADSYDEIQRAIRRVQVLQMSCSGCKADGQFRVLHVRLQKGNTVSDNLAIRLEPGDSSSWWREMPWWGWALGGTVVATLAGCLILLARRKPQPAVRNKVGHFGLAFPTPDVTRTTWAPGINIRLTVVRGLDQGIVHEFKLTGTAVIGRDRGCDVIVDQDQRVSGKHCELSLIDEKVVIYDLASTNKTVVNGVPIHGRHRLENRDSIVVGDTEMRLALETGL